MLIQTNHFKLSFAEDDASCAEKTAKQIENIYSQIITQRGAFCK